MELFTVLEDTFCILRSRGVFRQAKVFSRGTSLYAQWGNGWIQLRGDGSTTHPLVRWDELDDNPRIALGAGRFAEPLLLPPKPLELEHKQIKQED